MSELSKLHSHTECYNRIVAKHLKHVKFEIDSLTGDQSKLKECVKKCNCKIHYDLTHHKGKSTVAF